MENKDLFTENTDKGLLAAFVWWEKKRINFNIWVGITGCCFLFLLQTFAIVDFLGAFIYGIVANVFYCLGFFIEIATKYYFKKEIDFTEKRKLVFIFGTVISIIVTVAFGFLSLGVHMI